MKKKAELKAAGIEIISYRDRSECEGYIEKLMEIRKKKGMTRAEAEKLITDPLYYGAMLSYSTKGSAKHERLEPQKRTVRAVKEQYPNLKTDGELQLDAAIVPSVAKMKSKGSNVAGKANVLIFPDLNSGNNHLPASVREK